MSTPTAQPANTVETDPRYPIGKFKRDPAKTAVSAIPSLASLPADLRAALNGLTAAQLDTPYREGGWTVRQLVHHVADSHMNAYIRVRLALTEEWPTIQLYDEKRWAELADASAAPVEVSVELLDGMHRRWTFLLLSLTPEQWQRGFTHPKNGRQTIAEATLLYEWHSRHHVAHITELRKRMGW